MQNQSVQAGSAGGKSLYETLSKSVKNYRVISPLHHGSIVNGMVSERQYKPGETVELNSDEAEPLLGHTVVPMD